METVKSSEPTKKEKERMSIEKTENNFTTRIQVEEIEGGYLVTTNKYGNKDDKYVDETSKAFSKTNPLKKTEEDETNELKEGVNGLLDSLAGSEGLLNI